MQSQTRISAFSPYRSPFRHQHNTQHLTWIWDLKLRSAIIWKPGTPSQRTVMRFYWWPKIWLLSKNRTPKSTFKRVLKPVFITQIGDFMEIRGYLLIKFVGVQLKSHLLSTYLAITSCNCMQKTCKPFPWVIACLFAFATDLIKIPPFCT